jgi:hypothetical protein
VIALAAGCGRFDFDGRADAQTDVLGDASLVAWWKMDELVSADGVLGVADSSGVLQHYAECSGTTCPTIVAGKIGNAMAFDGVDDLLVAQSSPVLFDTNFTVGAWIAVDAPPADVSCGMTKALGTVQFDSWSACFTNALDTYYYSATDSASDQIMTSIALSAGDWHYIAIVWDGSTKTLFVDGNNVASDTPSGISFDEDPVYIGGDEDAGAPTAFLNGRVDDVRIYNRALTPSEIQALAAQ